MIKTPLMLTTLTAFAFALPAHAQEQSRTKTFEGPNVSAAQSITVNPETGTATRELEATNLNTGNTATSSAVRQRTEAGSTIDIVQTGPQGKARALSGERTRTGSGSTFAGTATGRGGKTLDLASERGRDGEGNSGARQSATNSAGETVFSRSRTTTRRDGQLSTNITRSGRKPGARSPRGRGGKRSRG
ncbi:MAG: hypothetical protein NXH71_10810 [Erythrobacteraceae bacterium]|jgi:hypothetical protein|nr:hypothetical protein [Erythrobacteraceae bacterium]